MKNKNYLLAFLLIIVCISSLMAQPIPGSAIVTLFGEVHESEIETFMDTYSDFDLKATRNSYYRNWDGTTLTITYNPKLVPNEDEAAFLEFLRQDSRVMDVIQNANLTIPSPPAFLYDNVIEPGIPRVFTDPNYVPYSPPPDTLGYHIEQGEFIPNDAFLMSNGIYIILDR
ncbi:MAG: hypothetical protein FWG98_05320 [Candidatus Cloacimonetes bacterium]|nr:hypothetical protein [Candidatus Cloacimonadota bacterium]